MSEIRRCLWCNGEGQIFSGVDESPSTICGRCDGDGVEPDIVYLLEKRVLNEHGGTGIDFVDHFNLTKADSRLHKEAINEITRLRNRIVSLESGLKASDHQVNEYINKTKKSEESAMAIMQTLNGANIEIEFLQEELALAKQLNCLMGNIVKGHAPSLTDLFISDWNDALTKSIVSRKLSA